MTLLSGDRALLDAFRRGDEEALTEVYFHYVDIISDLLQSGFYEKNTGANIFDPEFNREGKFDDKSLRKRNLDA